MKDMKAARAIRRAAIGAEGSLAYMTLNQAPLHELLVLVDADLEVGEARRLLRLGLRPGARLRLLQRLAGGGRVVSVEGARVALGHALLEKLTVRPAS